MSRTGFFVAAILALIWLILSRGDAGWLPAGVVAVVAAFCTWRRVAGPANSRMRWSRLPVLCGVFVWQSFWGGLDIARRMFSPNMRLKPGFVTFRLALPGQGPRVALMLILSLIPGALAVRIDGDDLILHALDLDLSIEADSRRIEFELALLLGVALEKPQSIA